MTAMRMMRQLMKKPIITLDLRGGHTQSLSVRPFSPYVTAFTPKFRSSPVGPVSLSAVHLLNSLSCQPSTRTWTPGLTLKLLTSAFS